MSDESPRYENRSESRGPHLRTAFLLSQVGSLAAARFAERLEPLGLLPGDVGLLRLISSEAPLSQQVLAERLGVVPSRVVVLVDSLEKKGLVVRERSRRDRRTYELRVSERGRDVMGMMRTIAADHEADIVSALSTGEHRELARLLGKIADAQGLDADVHPGFRRSHP